MTWDDFWWFFAVACWTWAASPAASRLALWLGDTWFGTFWDDLKEGLTNLFEVIRFQERLNNE